MSARWKWTLGGVLVLGVLAAAVWMLVFGDTGRGLRQIVAERAEIPDQNLRMRLMIEDPRLLRAVARGGAFGGDYSRQAAMNMFAAPPGAVEDVRRKTRVVEVAPRTWLIRFPIVNVALFETDAGLVLVDTGMTSAGPVLAEILPRLSDKPLHTVIYTHGHVDHAYGLRPLLRRGARPQIIAHEALPERFRRYLRLWRSIATYMSQPPANMPREAADLDWPTRVFSKRLELEIGGERFVLQHHRAETDDQLYVWVPGRKALASADYYQGFLPNAGNGKRVQRHPEEWAQALREMAGLGAEYLLPAHGEEIIGDARYIRESFTLLADALQSIVEQTIVGLNAGLRKDQVYRGVHLPESMARDPRLREQYVSVQDISKMVIKQYTGWWDDIPSHWTPAPLEEQAAEISALAGGVERLVERALALAAGDNLRLASHLVDWAWFSEPGNPRVQQAVLDIYRQRVLAPETNTMEMLEYLDMMALARARQLRRE